MARRRGSKHWMGIDKRRWAAVRRAVLDRDGWRCANCGRPGRLEVDHIKPLAAGGDMYAMENLQALCAFPCHAEKTAAESGHQLAAVDWRQYVKQLERATA